MVKNYIDIFAVFKVAEKAFKKIHFKYQLPRIASDDANDPEDATETNRNESKRSKSNRIETNPIESKRNDVNRNEKNRTDPNRNLLKNTCGPTITYCQTRTDVDVRVHTRTCA